MEGKSKKLREDGTAEVVEEEEEDDEELDEGLGFSLAPWAENVKVKPIFIVSDYGGLGAQLMVTSAWSQFGSPDHADLVVRPGVRSKISVDMLCEEASSCDPDDFLGGASATATAKHYSSPSTACGLIVYTVASRELSTHLISQCKRRRIMCINASEPILSAMEEFLNRRRQGSYFKEGPRDDEDAPSSVQRAQIASTEKAVFAVSCGAGQCTFHMVCASLRQFPSSGISQVTVCGEVRCLEEVRLIVQKAARYDSLVAFTFASSGMSRFMRQQCELAGVRYADLFQPVLIAMEMYLDHPTYGVPGGLDLKRLAEAELRWVRRQVV